MVELVAIGPEPGQRWRRPLPAGQVVRLGRSPRKGWAAPWDLRISREHANLTLEDETLHVTCLDTALNPCYVDGQPLKTFTVKPGEEFRIGATSFRLETPQSAAEATSATDSSGASLKEYSYRPEEVNGFDYQKAHHRLDVLWNLPEIIAGAANDQEFAQRLVLLLLDGIPRAEAAAVVQVDESDESLEPAMMTLETRSRNVRFEPSRRLLNSAVERGETILYVWTDQAGGSEYTFSGEYDWAFCSPITVPKSTGWALYISGRSWPDADPSEALNADIRFTQFVAQVTGAIRQVRSLEAQQAGLRQFFSPKVMQQLTGGDVERALAPRETNVTAMFCDLRGFSRKAEESGHDLQGLLQRCSDALGLMTEAILDQDGVIADFQGDAALGFWGWPVPEGPLPACRAALEMQAAFRRVREADDHPLADFRVGIGIAFGSAIAGKIGAESQAKVGVFGPVVNLASRLEGMTKILNAPILLDEATAEYLRAHPEETGGARSRCLGCYLPLGLSSPVVVSELLPPASDENAVSDADLATFESAIRKLTAGEWQDAVEIFEQLPESDQARNFPLRFMASHNNQPPPGWSGVIELSSK